VFCETVNDVARPKLLLGDDVETYVSALAFSVAVAGAANAALYPRFSKAKVPSTAKARNDARNGRK
jgi:hypothetical protein